MEALHDDIKKKVSNGYAKVIRYGYLKKNLPAKLKISPVAMISHKSRSYHAILGLYFNIQHRSTLIHLVNPSTVKQAPEESMIHLGHCVQQLIATLEDNDDQKTYFRFEKIYIKYGFWRLTVSYTDAWNFYHLLPQLKKVENIKNTKVVVPNCL